MIDTHLSIDQLYSKLCQNYRSLMKSKEAQEWICRNCQKPEKDHNCNSGRCTYYATSLMFKSDNTEILNNVEKCLKLVEELKIIPLMLQ